MSTLLRAYRPRLLAGLSVVLLSTACASVPGESPAQVHADRVLADKVENALNADPLYYFRHVSVQAHDGRVRLTGFVWSNDSIEQAERVARQVPGVTSVADELVLEREGSTAG